MLCSARVADQENADTVAALRAELAALRIELDESNRGIIALHDELSERAAALQQVADARTRLVSSVSHELRTPLNAIIGLARILLQKLDGPLLPEQEKQVGFMLKSGEMLSVLVGNLLDHSKLEAGKDVFRPAKFTVASLFGGLRGMLRPMMDERPHVALEIVDPASAVELETDETKLGQVLRNLLSNALKFTEKGRVRLTATSDGPTTTFFVEDTGVGIAPEHHERIFEEFAQVDGPLQRTVKGTGLGLAISRRLAGMLGGRLTVQSQPGHGSTFILTIPTVHAEVGVIAALRAQAEVPDPDRAPILIVEDDPQTLFLYEKYLSGAGFQIFPARSVEEARESLQRARPAAIVLDVMLEGDTTWRFLEELKQNPDTRDIPTMVLTVTNADRHARALGADEFCVKPVDPEWLLSKVRSFTRGGAVEKILLVDDDEVSRYVLRRHFAGMKYVLLEADTGAKAIATAASQTPQAIVLDFILPDMTALDVLDALKANPLTRSIPVIVVTAKNLTQAERQRLKQEDTAVLQKESLSRELALARVREALGKAGLGHGALREPGGRS